MKLHKRLVRFTFILAGLFIFGISNANEAAAKGTLRISPDLKYLSIGELFEFSIILNSDTSTIGTDVILTYDPEILSVVDIIPGTMFSDYPIATFDNTQGIAKMSGIAGSKADQFTGEGIFGTIKIQGKKAGHSNLIFEFTPDSTTDTNIVTLTEPGDTLTTTSPAIIIINPTTVTPMVTAVESSADLHQPTTEPEVVYEQPKLTFWDKVKIFLRIKEAPQPPIDNPTAPITSQAPNRDPSNTQPTATTPTTVTQPPESDRIVTWQLLVGLLVLIAALITAYIIWKRNKPRNVIINN